MYWTPCRCGCTLYLHTEREGDVEGMSKNTIGAVLALAIALAGFVSLLYPVVNPDSLAEVALEIDRAEGKVRLDFG